MERVTEFDTGVTHVFAVLETPTGVAPTVRKISAKNKICKTENGRYFLQMPDVADKIDCWWPVHALGNKEDALKYKGMFIDQKLREGYNIVQLWDFEEQVVRKAP